ncbi:unnamed protein product [Caenorhabditis nigoni]
MGSAKWYLLNLHVTCILLDWGITVLGVPYLILPAMGGYTLGILRYWFGVPIVVQCYLALTLAFFVATSILLIFENRFYQLYARNRSWHYLRIPFIIINYLLDATHMLPVCFMVPDQKIALELALKNLQNLTNGLFTPSLQSLALSMFLVFIVSFI